MRKNIVAVGSIVLAVFLISLALPANAKTIYVNTTGNDQHPGINWDLAKKTVSSAISSAIPGDEVWVAAGVYIERINLRNGVALYGGFTGDEIDKSQRDWRKNATVLDGDQKNIVVTVNGQQNTMSSLTRIDGFIIRNGGGKGGVGITCSYSNLTITNNIITNNTSVNDYGGGIHCYNGRPVITNNIITRNSVTGTYYPSSGSGITLSYCSAAILNNTIVGNTSNEGAGIFIYGLLSEPTVIANNIIAFNSSGIFLTKTYDSLNVCNNCIYGNSAYAYKGLSQGSGDILRDPEFAGYSYGDFRLMSGSPCIDMGWNDAPGLPSIDIGGHPRIYPDDGIIDIGAYEWNASDIPEVQKVVRVSPSGDDNNDGSTWNLAMKTIQAAVDAVGMEPGEVWAKAGTYADTTTGYLFMRPRVHVYGGFTGSETDRLQRTLVMEQPTGRPLNVSVIEYQTVFMAEQSRLDSFTIKSGPGGGIICSGGSSTVSGNIISNGGIYCRNSQAVITNNIITGVTGGCEGAITCDSGSPIVTNNTIVYNTVPGIYCSGSTAAISNNIVAYNLGGIYCNRPPVVPNPILPVLRNNNLGSNSYYAYYGVQPGTGDISATPYFMNRYPNDFHQYNSSAFTDRGWNEAPGLLSFDIDGEGRIAGKSVDIGADESWGGHPNGIAELKKAADGALFRTSNYYYNTPLTVSAAFSDFFYVQSSNRCTGLRVDKPGHTLKPGQYVAIIGNVRTNSNGERYIAADIATYAGTSTTYAPVFLPNHMLGGSAFGLQGGVWSWQSIPKPEGGSDLHPMPVAGLNNIGLLVKTCGKVTQIDPAGQYFYIDDGSGIKDGTKTDGAENVGVRVQADGTSYSQGQFLAITGASSCFKTEDGKMRRLLRQVDVTTIQ